MPAAERPRFKTEWMLRGAQALKTDSLCRGTRILAGRGARAKREIYVRWAELLEARGFVELELPSVEPLSLYTDKAGPEVMGQTYHFQDKGGDAVCLRPEGTATCQALARRYASNKDFACFYMARCWRYERPQEGRYREFTQFGVEVLNPRVDHAPHLIELGMEMLGTALPEGSFALHESVCRGLAYYTGGTGWEVECAALGAQKQILGGGPYAEGVGFAIGLDRVLVAIDKLAGGG